MALPEIFDIGDVFEQEASVHRGHRVVQRIEASMPDEILIEIGKHLVEKLARRICYEGMRGCHYWVHCAHKLMSAINNLRAVAPKLHGICVDIFYQQMDCCINFSSSGPPLIEPIFETTQKDLLMMQKLQKATVRVAIAHQHFWLPHLLSFLQNPKAILPNIKQITIDLRATCELYDTPMDCHRDIIMEVVQALDSSAIEQKYIGGAEDHFYTGLRMGDVPYEYSYRQKVHINRKELTDAIIVDMEVCNYHQHHDVGCDGHSQYLVRNLN